MKKIRIIDLLLTFLLLSMLVGSFVYVSKINLNDKSNEIEIEAEENFGSENVNNREADFTWDFDKQYGLDSYEKGKNEEIQSLIDEIHPYINLAYKYQTLSEPISIHYKGSHFRTKYLNVDFRFFIGLTKSVYETFSGYDNTIIGVELSTIDTYYRFTNLNNIDGEINFVNVAVGDMININNALIQFKFKPFVIYEDEIYYSNNFKNYSVVKMVETYYLNEVEEVKSLYEIYVKKGYIKEEVL